MATQKRIIWLPKTTATTSPNQSTIAGWTSSLLPTNNATANLGTTTTAPTTTTGSKYFSDNIAKPIVDTPVTTPPTTTPTPTPTANEPTSIPTVQTMPLQNEAIGQNADGTLIYANQKPTTPAPTWVQYDANGNVIDNKSNQDLQTVNELKNAAQVWMSTPTIDKLNEWWLAAINLDLSNYQSTLDNLNASQANYQKQKELDLQKLAIEHNAEIDQVKQQFESQINQATMWWALRGTGQSSLYWQGIDRLKTNMDSTIMKLNELYTIATQSVWANADEAMTKYSNALKDARAQFEYNYRDVTTSANYDLNKIMAMAWDLWVWFDREKLNKSLDVLSSNVYAARQKALWTYIDNVQKEQDILNWNIDWLLKMQQYNQVQTKWLTTQLDMNDWAATLQLNDNQLSNYVSQWLLTQSQAVWYKMQAEQKAYNELIKYSNETTYDGKVISPWRIDQADVAQLRSLVAWGYTYAQAVQKIVTENPSKYNPTPIVTPMEKIQMQNAQSDIAYRWAQMWMLWAQLQEQQMKNQTTANTLLQQQATEQWLQIANTISDPQTQQYIWSTSQQRRGRENLQCGELVNDYLRQVTGKWKGASLWSMNLWNSYQEKINALNNIWRSSEPQVWWIFVMKVDGSTKWHTGIITAVNWNKITVYDANWKENSDQWGKPISRTIDINKNMTFSVSPWQKMSDLNDISSTIIWSGKFTKDQTSAIIGAIQKWNNPLEVVKNQARDLLWAWPKKDLIDLESSLSSMQSLQEALKEYYANWWSTNIFSWNIEKVYNKLWATTDPKLTGIQVKIRSALQKYRNAISGTAYSDKEWADIESIFPWIKKGKILNDAIVQAKMESMSSDIDSAYANVLWRDSRNAIKQYWWQPTTTTQNNNNPSSPSNTSSATSFYSSYKK